jgi:dTDP-glucose 4,6-dehydratase
VPVLIVRSSNNYVPFQFPEKLIPLLMRNALQGRDLPLYGDGAQRRDWLFVEDNCEALFLVLNRGEIGTIYNVAAGEVRTNLDVTSAVCRFLAEETMRDPGEFLSRIRSVADRPGHDRRYAMDSSKIRQELGWSPRVSFEHALRMTVQWYLGNAQWLEQVASSIAYRDYEDSVYVRNWGLGR